MKHVRSQVPLPPGCQPWIEIRKLVVMTASIPLGPADFANEAAIRGYVDGIATFDRSARYRSKRERSHPKRYIRNA